MSFNFFLIFPVIRLYIFGRNITKVMLCSSHCISDSDNFNWSHY